LHLHINAKHNAGQATSTVFQVFIMTQLGIEPSLGSTCSIRWTI